MGKSSDSIPNAMTDRSRPTWKWLRPWLQDHILLKKPVSHLSARSARLLIVTAFVGSRALAYLIKDWRRIDHLGPDARMYISIADYITSHGKLPVEERLGLRQFPGISILIALFNMIINDSLFTGICLSNAASVLALWTFYEMFGGVRVALVLVTFSPGWIHYTVMTEGLCFLLLLLIVQAASTQERSWRSRLLLTVGGFVVVVKPTLAFPVISYIVVSHVYCQRSKSCVLIIRDFAWLSISGWAYLLWNYITIGDLWPQARLYRKAFDAHTFGYYPTGLITYPFYSLVMGLLNPRVHLSKKLSTLGTVAANIGGAVSLWIRGKQDLAENNRSPAWPMAAAVMAHFCFHMFIGGSYGFSGQDRYLAQLSPFLVYGLFYQREPRNWAVIVLFVIGSVFSGFTWR